MKKLALQYFIEQNRNWEELLSQKPYSLHISRDTIFGRNLVMFKYDMLNSDMNIGLCREARGIILDEDTLEVVSMAFYKFFNVQEGHADTIDWNNCWTSSKIDGSICKIVRLGDNFLMSTNGTIDAFKAQLQDQIGCPFNSFGDLIIDAVIRGYNKIHNDTISDKQSAFDWLKTILDDGYTYIFELTSKWNHIVVKFDKPELHFLGVRDNTKLQEIPFFEHNLKNIFHTPELYPLNNLEDCLKATEAMGNDQEGFVVCDKLFHRVKIKSPCYCALHHMRQDDGSLSLNSAIEVIKRGTVDDILAQWPEFKPTIDELISKFEHAVDNVQKSWDKFNSILDTLPTRKDQAIWIKDNSEFPGIMFALLDKKIDNPHDAVYSLPNKTIIKMFGYKE